MFILFFLLVLFPSRLFILFLIVLFNFYLIKSYRINFKINSITFRLFSIYLIFVYISTLLAPDFWFSFWGHYELQDGFIFWLLIFLFYFTNQSLIHLPNILDNQLLGIQTATFINMMCSIEYPLGFFTNRAHNAIFTTLVLVFSELNIFNLFGTVVILFLRNRVSIIARIFSLPTKYWILLPLPLLLIIRHLPVDTHFEEFASGRLWRYSLAEVGILIHPWFGWGFDSFRYVSHYLHPTISFSYKAHNFFLDLFLQLGLFGGISYLLLLINLILSLPFDKIKFVGIYFLSVYFWYDCAEITWLLFWYFSINIKP